MSARWKFCAGRKARFTAATRPRASSIIVSAKPTDQYEAMASVDVGNYNNRRLEGMLNVPIVGDKLDLRVAGEWTKRDGYTFNEETGQSRRWPRSVVGPRVVARASVRKTDGQFDLGAFPAKTTTASVRPNSFATSDPGACCRRWTGRAAIHEYRPVTARGWLSRAACRTSLYAPTAFETPNRERSSVRRRADYAFSPYHAARCRSLCGR